RPSFFFSRLGAHPYLPSFPTRRSSDLREASGAGVHRAGGLDGAGAGIDRGEGGRAAAGDRPAVAGEGHGVGGGADVDGVGGGVVDRKSTRLNSSHLGISYAVFCLKKKN